VEKSGPADKAGLEASDVILKFDDKTINTSSDLPRIVGSTKPGSKVTLQIWRKGAAKDILLTVGEIPADEKIAQRSGKRSKASDNRLGMALSDLTADQRSELGIRSGILVEEVQGTSARAGIRRGDIILAVNNHDVKSVEQFNQLLNKFEKGRTIALLVRRGDSALYIPLRIDGN
jgi:serine protease Do